MQKMREFYANQAAEAANVVEVKTSRIDAMTDEFGRPVHFADGRPWGYQIDGAFDVRRFDYDGGGLTQVTIKVAFDAKPGIGTPELLKMKADVRAGVDAHYNKGQILPNGDRLNVQVEFVPKGSGEHLTVELDMKARSSRADQTHWFVGDDPMVHAHELGHQMGLLDEYLDPRAINRATPSSAGVKTDDSLMGNFWQSRGVVNPNASLKERHLAQIHGDIEAARTGTATAGSAPRGTGPAGAAPDVDLPPIPELSPAQMDRMGQLHEGLGGAEGWSDMGYKSIDDMKRHFANFDSIDDAIEDLEIQFKDRAELKATGPGGTDDLNYHEAQALGLIEPDARPPEVVNPTDLPEYRASIDEASGKFSELSNIEQGKNVALGGAEEQGLSGWGGDQVICLIGPGMYGSSPRTR